MTNKGKTKESLANSKKVRSNFLFKMGTKDLPHSILYNDRSDKAIDIPIKNGRSYNKSNKKALDKIENRLLRKTFDVSGQSVRGGKTGALSRFPQNVGKTFVRFFCPENRIMYDPFAGHNSRMELTYTSNRSYIGVDISHEFMQANYKIQETLEKRMRCALFKNKNTIQLIECNSNEVDLDNEIADFTITSPPYWDLEYYGDEKEQLGNAKTYRAFIHFLYKHVKENHRILKPGSYCVWCINDFTKNKVFYPYHVDIIKLFKEAGFSIYNICIIDLGTPITTAFVKTLIATKRFPKRHEYCIIGKKEGENQQVEEHIQNLIK